MEHITNLDISIYQKACDKPIRSSDLILTDNQKEHIIKRRGQSFYDKLRPYFKEIVEEPDFIFVDNNHKNSVIVCKTINVEKNNINIVIRLAVETDDPWKKNSIITVILENNKRNQQRIRNNIYIYKRK